MYPVILGTMLLVGSTILNQCYQAMDLVFLYGKPIIVTEDQVQEVIEEQFYKKGQIPKTESLKVMPGTIATSSLNSNQVSSSMRHRWSN